MRAQRERVLRAAAACFDHRLMMDRVVPGGVAADINVDGANLIRALLADVRLRFPPLGELYDNTTSLQDRTAATGIVSAELGRRAGQSGGEPGAAELAQAGPAPRPRR
jgi:Ni,Fe-hydrogenase III large subunit